MKKRLGLILALALLASMLGGLGAQAQTDWITAEDISDMPETTIHYWYYESAERIELGQKQVEEFMAKYPNIKVVGSTAPNYTDNEMLMSYIQTQTNSSIHQSVNNEDLWYVEHKMLYPLNNFPDFEKVYARFNPALNYTHPDGNTYSISWYNEPYFMLYDKKALETLGIDVPRTYSEYYAFAEAVTDPANKKWAIVPDLGEEWWRWEFVAQPFYIAARGNAQYFDEEGKLVINNENMVQAHEFFAKLYREGWAVNDKFNINPFFSGNTASALGSIWLVPQARENAPKDFEYVIGPIPKPDGSENTGYETFSFVRNLCILDPMFAKDKDEGDRIRRASWEFMKFLLSDEQCAADFLATGSFPCVAEFENNPVYNEAIEAFGREEFEALKAIRDTGCIGDIANPMVCDIMGTLQDAYLQSVLNGVDPAQALAVAEEESLALLEAGLE